MPESDIDTRRQSVYGSAVAFDERFFRHELRNIRNSLGLAMRAYEISSPPEQVELLDMMIATVEQAITLIDNTEFHEDSAADK